MWVRVKISDALDVDHDELVSGAFEGEMAECVWRLPAHPVVHETRVGVVLDVLPVDEVLHMVEGAAGTLVELQNGHHEDVHLLRWIVSAEEATPNIMDFFSIIIYSSQCIYRKCAVRTAVSHTSNGEGGIS